MPRPAGSLAVSVDAVLLDMDGTLVDSHEAIERAWTDWASGRNADPAAAIEAGVGVPAEVTVQHLFPDLSEAEVAAEVRTVMEPQYDDTSGVALCPGADDLVRWLEAASVPWAVVTSADRQLAVARLASVGIRPPLLVTADDVEWGKPDPSCYKLAARILRKQPSRCLVVEDSEAGLEAGHRAGCVTAGLNGLDADIPIIDLGELVPLLQTPARPGQSSSAVKSTQENPDE
jgi:sugar-phosphatase